MMLCHQCLPTRHFVVRDQSYRHLSERKGCVRRYCCHGLSITPRPRDVHDLIERINDADYRDYAEALRVLRDTHGTGGWAVLTHR